jgi:hypothetical protein
LLCRGETANRTSSTSLPTSYAGIGRLLSATPGPATASPATASPATTGTAAASKASPAELA